MSERLRFYVWCLRYVWPLLQDLAELLREWRKTRAYILRNGWHIYREDT